MLGRRAGATLPLLLGDDSGVISLYALDLFTIFN